MFFILCNKCFEIEFLHRAFHKAPAPSETLARIEPIIEVSFESRMCESYTKGRTQCPLI